MFKCTTPEYERLYAPWTDAPLTLPVLARWNRGEPLLDLCGGAGAVSRALLCGQPKGSLPNPYIVLFDLKPRACWWADAQERLGRFREIRGDANRLDTYPGIRPESFGVVVCRQAMGYLEPEKVIPAVATVLTPGGRFVFNTFKKPSRVRFKTYLHDGVRYVEAHLYLWGRIVHLQARLSHQSGADLTVFRYWPREYLQGVLEANGFAVQVHEANRSLRWLCTKGEAR